MTWFSCIVSLSTCVSLFFAIIFSADVLWAVLWMSAFHWTLWGPPYAPKLRPCPSCCPRGPPHWQWCHLFPPPQGDTSEWFVVWEDWWTAIATLFLCKINSTCRRLLYEWWRPPQAIHTAAQRHSPGPHSTYKAGIKQSLFSTGPCITLPLPHMKMPTWIHR